MNNVRYLFRILQARDYTLLLGMPGTGKSSTIVQAVIALLAAGASVLLMSYTNRCTRALCHRTHGQMRMKRALSISECRKQYSMM